MNRAPDEQSGGDIAANARSEEFRRLLERLPTAELRKFLEVTKKLTAGQKVGK